MVVIFLLQMFDRNNHEGYTVLTDVVRIKYYNFHLSYFENIKEDLGESHDRVKKSVKILHRCR